jgi:hypothetical protein
MHILTSPPRTAASVRFRVRVASWQPLEEDDVDIEEFYDADPRRRVSDEVEFGQDWTDADAVRCEVSWVADTGELYVMREPNAPINMDPVGDEFIEQLPTESVTVEVLGVVATRDAVDALLDGWQQAMGAPNSIEWVRGRLVPPGGTSAPGS